MGDVYSHLNIKTTNNRAHIDTDYFMHAFWIMGFKFSKRDTFVKIIHTYCYCLKQMAFADTNHKRFNYKYMQGIKI